MSLAEFAKQVDKPTEKAETTTVFVFGSIASFRGFNADAPTTRGLTSSPTDPPQLMHIIQPQVSEEQRLADAVAEFADEDLELALEAIDANFEALPLDD